MLVIGNVQSDEFSSLEQDVLVSSFAAFVRYPCALAHLQPLGWLLLEQSTKLKSPVLE